MPDSSTHAPILYLVVPCYNEEEVLHSTASQLLSKLHELRHNKLVAEESRILFVNDGSSDSTWMIICDFNKKDPGNFTGITLSHNRGHQNALFAGLMDALNRGADITISIDADLQDDIDVINEMITRYLEGSNIVYGVRNNRDTDTVFKRKTAEAFYQIMSFMGTETIPNSADFRLMDSRSLEALSEYGEANLYLRGIVPSLGFNTEKVYYRRKERTAGESKYPLSKMIALAIDGITSFSVSPLRFVTLTGLLFVLISIVAFIYALSSLASGRVVSGWTSILISIWFVSGALMLSLGIVGEYVGRIYLESKHRPRYIVSERLN